MKTSKGIVDELRKAIRAAERQGITRYRIAKLTGMPQSQVGRIASGETEPLLSSAERICKAIGVKLVIVAK